MVFMIELKRKDGIATITLRRPATRNALTPSLFRELAARFGDLLAIKWNLGEECNHPVPRLRDFATWLRAVDAFDHPIAFHTHPLTGNGDYPPYEEALGEPLFEMTSIQGSTQTSGLMVERWRADSAAAGQPWVLRPKTPDFCPRALGQPGPPTFSL